MGNGTHRQDRGLAGEAVRSKALTPLPHGCSRDNTTLVPVWAAGARSGAHDRSWQLEMGDAVFFRGESLTHWVRYMRS